MTLKEYLESYDEPLNEGVIDNIKEKVKNFKKYAKTTAVALGAIAIILGSLNLAGTSFKNMSKGIWLNSYIESLEDSKSYIEQTIKDKNNDYKFGISPDVINKANNQIKAAENVINNIKNACKNTNTFSKDQTKKIDEAIKKAETSIKICNQIREELWQQIDNDETARDFRKMRQTGTYLYNSGTKKWINPAINQSHFKNKKRHYPYVK